MLFSHCQEHSRRSKLRKEILEKYEVGLVLIDRGSALATLLHEDGDWRKAYEDEVAVIFSGAER